VNVVHTDSALRMRDEVMRRLDGTDIVIKAAAVADYRPASRADQKIKKSSDSLTLELVRNPDILQEVGEWREARDSGPFIVGFAAETADVERHALDKLARKKCDLIVANNVSEAGAGFGTETNIVSVYGRGGFVEHLPQMTKRAVAERLLDIVKDARKGSANR